MLKYTKLLAAMALGVVAIHAQAVTQAQLIVSNLGYELKDLRPNDGVAAALTFASALGQASVGQQAQTGWTVTQDQWGPTYQPTLSSWQSVNDYQVGSTATAAMPAAFSSVQQSAAGLEQLTVATTVSEGARSSVGSYFYQGFTLAAGTQVTFSVLVNGALSGVGTLEVVPGSVYADHSSASFQASMWIDGFNLQSSLNRSGQSQFNRTADDFDQTIDGQLLTLTLKNNSSSIRGYQLTVAATAWASESTSPIPEPSTYALMALGLLGVGAATRRQRRG